MKKIMATISALLVCITVLSGCGSDPVQDDLINYINNQVPTIATLEKKVTTEYTAVKEDSTANNETFAAKLKDVIIPADDELIAKAKAVVPATEEVKKVHDKYIASVTAQNEAFTLLLEAAQKNDEALVKTANEKLENSDKISKEYLADLEALKKEHDVENKK